MDSRQVYRAQATRGEIEDVLGQRLTATVGTLNEDGSIHLAFVIFLFEADRLLFETSSITRKARNVLERGTASAIVQGTAAGTGRGIMVAIEGRGRVLTGDEARAANHRIRAKYVTAEALPDLHRAWDEMDDVAIEIVPARWRSWTGEALADATARATGLDYESIWKPDG